MEFEKKRFIDLPVGTRFYVINGDYHADVIQKDNEKWVILQDGYEYRLDDKQLYIEALDPKLATTDILVIRICEQPKSTNIAVVLAESKKELLEFCRLMGEEQGFRLSVELQEEKTYLINYIGEYASECAKYLMNMMDPELSSYGIGCLQINIDIIDDELPY